MSEQPPLALAPSAAGRVSGKPWKPRKSAAVYVPPPSSLPRLTRSHPSRSHMPDGGKTRSWADRMQKTEKEKAIKKLQAELKEEKVAERNRRREITLERKKAAEERRRLEEDKAKMGARKAARLRRKAGRTKKINH
ncbi:hypothetical protein WOLCODRAFT_63927 [Wolfiporia cocos MD-104 SS10]|uniref:rRNA-processing protein n=1 Tax=Wolfiporia cocos (strain MD-104) TaxID=742152 RepID=A0A2H3IV19_WOLCO|nr:hypothetical protein WOLCODRAFT_63927 [Wolfiporia cocos MD-104 SS10]